MTVDDARSSSEAEAHGPRQADRGEVLKEIALAARVPVAVGLGYLSLDRAGPTLSGGESQRIRLASQVGSELTGVIYILDEPSIGLHQRDNRACSTPSIACATSETPSSWSSTTRRRSAAPTT